MEGSVRFIKSTKDYKECPAPIIPEYAFIGRSNVGKSSLINMITETKNLAKISSKPGKTQLINHFIIEDKWYLVDLPGYGWAQASKESRISWDKMIKEYFLHRENLINVFLLIDSRIEPQKIDLEFLHWLGNMQLPFCLVFTKCDKQSKSKSLAVVDKFLEKLTATWEEMPQYFLSSSETGLGKSEILTFIKEVNKTFNL